MSEMPFFDKNINMLREQSPALASLLANTAEFANLEVISSLSGPPTLRASANYGEGHFIHSLKDPVAEARELVAGQNFLGEDATVLFGFGLGYLAKEIQARMSPDHDLFVVEQLPEVFKAAMHHVDLSDILRDKRIRLCLGLDSFQLIDQFTQIQRKALTGKINKLIYSPVTSLAAEQYNVLENDLNNFIGGLISSVVSFKSQIPIRLRNLFRNIPVLVESSSSSFLEGVFSNQPAVVVAAGPSLDKNVGRLKKMKGGAVIIAVDAALKPLIANETVPDIVVTMEPARINVQKVDGINAQVIGKTCLVYDPEGNSEIPKYFIGPKFYVNTGNTFSDWLVGHIGQLPHFPTMFTVSHLGFLLARHLGCNPIILAGLDLSFPEDKHHASGCALTWTPNFNAMHLVEIEDIYGNKVKTSDSFIQMLNLLEREINKTEVLCIDATEGGALIRGTTIMSMDDAIEEYLPDKAIAVASKFHRACLVDDDLARKRLKEGLEWLALEIEHANSSISRGEKLVEEAKDLIDEGKQNSQEFFDILSGMNELRDRILLQEDFFNILGDLMTELLIYESKWHGKNSTASQPKYQHLQYLERYEVFFTEVKKTINLLQQNLNISLSRHDIDNKESLRG